MICVCCVIVQLYINVHMYFLVAVIFDSNMYCITVICSIFYISTMNCHLLLCELLSTTVWNTSILCHIHDFNKKFQVVVKLLIFILEISLTYLNKYLFLIVALHDM